MGARSILVMWGVAAVSGCGFTDAGGDGFSSVDSAGIKIALDQGAVRVRV